LPTHDTNLHAPPSEPERAAGPAPQHDATAEATRDKLREHLLPRRRRIYLMRHGAVDYFDAHGAAVPPDTVPLNATGRAQADAAGALFAASGVQPDKVVVSGLPRTVETAERLLAAAGLTLPLHIDAQLQEIRPGRLGDIPRAQLAEAFLGAFRYAGGDTAALERHRFMGGESIGELLDRVLPAFDAQLAATDWQTLLLVLHGGVNRALLASAMSGGRAFFGRIEQAPACINVIDVGAGDMVVRAVNLAPTQWLHQHERHTTMERMLAQFLQVDAQAS
jgi:broad specificity phosphatase PhoE